MLHALDDLDAKTQMVQHVLANAKPDNNWSGFHKLLERHIYLLNSQGTFHLAYPQPEPEAKVVVPSDFSLFKGLE